ncbi:anti-sigma factor family protein [Anaerobaca lacustris]|uniref:Zf-HC2 domain-containing protein n=1 Tax=Anaerobaca lacustris TaxID=3044600 RepID=A0AAW6U4W2_9BACT|nr:zf-HC2 domain-containing protein [Sedimentisphaerales bacterium M17dextr]
MNRPCRDIRERIIDHMLGVLSAEQAQDVQSHLDACQSCRQYVQALTGQGDALAALGRKVQADMNIRRDKAIEAFRRATPAGPRVLPFVSRFVRTVAAAVLVLGVGILIGRLTSRGVVDVEQLSAALQSSIRHSVLAEMDDRLESALAGSEERVAAALVEQVREDLHLFATDLVSGTETLVDQRFAEIVQLIEAARQTDRRQVARALEQVRTQTGMGFLRLAALTEEAPPRHNQ